LFAIGSLYLLRLTFGLISQRFVKLQQFNQWHIHAFGTVCELMERELHDTLLDVVIGN
jgi:hypothetical protein